MISGAGTKRAAEDSTSTTSPRGSKVQKTEESTESKKNGKKAAKKTQTALSTTEFKLKALPLYVHLTHTPPSIPEKLESDVAVTGDSESEPKDALKVDSATIEHDTGLIENLTLEPASFTTGSYGWKLSKRITVELQGGDEDGEGDKEKVQVMLSINATVIGSKHTGKTGRGSKKHEEWAEVEADHEAD